MKNLLLKSAVYAQLGVAALIVSGGTFAFSSVAQANIAPIRTTSFEAFDKRAKAGEKLNVAFFGASLTWGANASDPLRYSYRAGVAKKLEATYPKAHFNFFDGAIGGTGSMLGVYRLQRDVLGRKPDLVFLDFSANDDIYTADPESLASYESLVRRVVTEGKVPLVQVIFPFEWNIKAGEMDKMPRRTAHRAIARAYGVPVGDAIQLINEKVSSKQVDIKKIWPLDPVHPGDYGYTLFAEAAFNAYQSGVKGKSAPSAPKQMLNASTYMTWNRARISQLGPLPAGWTVGRPNRTSAYFDFLMSRWLDDEVVASNRASVTDVQGKTQSVPQKVDRLKVYFRGSSVSLLGETTLQTGKYRAYIDGKVVERKQNRATVVDYDPGSFGKAINGNGHHVQVIAIGLDPNVRHLLEIEPVFSADSQQELRLESICVAGGPATVSSIYAKKAQ